MKSFLKYVGLPAVLLIILAAMFTVEEPYYVIVALMDIIQTLM